jgi:cobalt-zinc-cadmium efflux system outer membrane protein
VKSVWARRFWSIVTEPRGVGLLVVMSASITSAARAEPAGQGDSVWTLASATDFAVQRSPQVVAARAALEAARAYRAYGSMPWVGNPTLGVRAMLGRPDDPAATYAGTLGLPFDVSGRRRARRAEANWIEREAEARLWVTQNDVRSDAREAFVDVALGLELERVAVGNAEVAGDFLARVKARFEARAATALDVALSHRDYAESTAAVAQARERLMGARGRLRQVLDLAPSAALDTAPLPAPHMPEGLSLEQAIDKALKQRREPEVFNAGAERAAAADTRLRREAIAPLMLQGEYEAQGNNNTQTSGGVGLSAELPVVLKNQGDRAVVRAEGQLAKVNAELVQRRVGREAMMAFQQLEASLLELAAIEQEAMPAAEQALAMTMEMLEAGAIDFFRLLNARQSAFGLRARRVEVVRNAWRLRIALERSMGGLEGAP